MGKLIITDFWGAAAIVVAANSAVKIERVAKRISKKSIGFCGGERSLYQVRYSAMVVCCGVVDDIRKVPKWMPGV